MNNIKNFIIKNYFSLIKGIIGVFLIYWIIFVVTPKTGMSTEQKQQLDSLSAQIKILHEDNLKLEGEIDEYNRKISEVDSRIDKIKGQKTIVKEIYHEKISNVDKLTVRELDSFFTDRYSK